MIADDPSRSLTLRLFAMPLARVIDALEAIDDLDLILLKMHEEQGGPEVESWCERIRRRREDRRRFLKLRLEAELASPRMERRIQ